MTKSDQFSFSDDSVASAYNNVLVPVLFEPWAISLIEEKGPWEGSAGSGSGYGHGHRSPTAGAAGRL